MNLRRAALGTFFLLTSIICLPEAKAQSDEDVPFGFATMASRTEAGKTFNLTGGGCCTYPVTGVDAGQVKVLTAKNVTKDDDIKNAIKNYSVIVFDGKDGDIIVNKYIKFGSSSSDGVKNKTILGINNARLVTKWYLTAEDRALLDNANVKSASTSGGGGTLSNGVKVKEEAEYLVRKTLLAKYGNEDYREAGVFMFVRSQNIIIRNIKFVGPGSVDCGGYDLLAIQESKNFWVDHCEFTDGIDGNFDITNDSDFGTISWCKFSYTERAYMHMNTNLVGSSDSDGQGKLNMTFAYNHWVKGCDQRMPMARSGKIHMLNNYYTCTSAKATINARKNSEFMIEGNYFDGVKNVFSESSSTAYVWVKDGDNANVIPVGVSTPSSKGTVTMPYQYKVVKAADIPAIIKEKAGATLFGSSAIVVVQDVAEGGKISEAYNIHGQKVVDDVKGLQIRNGKKNYVK